MIFQILVLLLILAIAFYQSTQGFYSAIIMAIAAGFSCVIAFNYFEPLAAQLVSLGASGSEGLALLALFIIPLLIIRVATGVFLKANVVFGAWYDRIGGGIIGFFTGMICTGLLVVAMGLMPFGADILGYKLSDLGYKTHDDSLKASHLWLMPDEFVIGMVGKLSAGTLSGSFTWASRHGDFRLDSFCASNDAGRGGRLDAPADALDAMKKYPDAGAYIFDDWDAFSLAINTSKKLPKPPFLADADYAKAKVLVLRVKVNDSACDKKDDMFHLPATHFKLITADRQGSKTHYPLAYLTYPTKSKKSTAAYSYDQYILSLATIGSHWQLTLPPAGETISAPALAKLAVSRRWYKKGGPENLTVDWVYLIGPNDRLISITFRKSATIELGPKSGKSRKNKMPKTLINIHDKKTANIIETIIPLERQADHN